MSSAADPRLGLFAALVAGVSRGEGVLERQVRAGLVSGRHEVAQPELAAYLEKVAHASYTVTDGEVASLLDVLPEDAVFEATVATAVGEARRRVEAAVALLDGGKA
jgi:hypothetical protein